ncbi:MAG: HD domain-containing protein [Minisyncoccia bacterium]
MKNKFQKLVSFFYELGTLRRILRSHQQTLFFKDESDNISSHSFRTAFIGYFLAKELNADVDKVIKMCLLHDIEEARAGDQNWVNKRYLKVYEEEIREEQLKKLPNSKELLEISKEYQERKTLEAKIAKDADLLDEILLLKEYEFQGSKEAKDWLKGKRESQQEKLMFTKLAKEIAKK